MGLHITAMVHMEPDVVASIERVSSQTDVGSSELSCYCCGDCLRAQ